MTDAIVMSFGEDYVTASPTSNIDVKELKGKEAVYKDPNDKEWKGVVKEIEGDFVLIVFESFPKNIGQGQIINIKDGND